MELSLKALSGIKSYSVEKLNLDGIVITDDIKWFFSRDLARKHIYIFRNFDMNGVIYRCWLEFLEKFFFREKNAHERINSKKQK